MCHARPGGHRAGNGRRRIPAPQGRLRRICVLTPRARCGSLPCQSRRCAPPPREHHLREKKKKTPRRVLRVSARTYCAWVRVYNAALNLEETPPFSSHDGGAVPTPDIRWLAMAARRLRTSSEIPLPDAVEDAAAGGGDGSAGTC